MASASATARSMDCTVASMLTTTPLRMPRDAAVPTPMTSMPSSVTSPTMAAILVVPMSRPTMSSSRFALAISSPRPIPQGDGDAPRPGPLVQVDGARRGPFVDGQGGPRFVEAGERGRVAPADRDGGRALQSVEGDAVAGEVDLAE